MSINSHHMREGKEYLGSSHLVNQPIGSPFFVDPISDVPNLPLSSIFAPFHLEVIEVFWPLLPAISLGLELRYVKADDGGCLSRCERLDLIPLLL